jgi:glycosyltransferase involved in cell wall biosynthesis
VPNLESAIGKRTEARAAVRVTHIITGLGVGGAETMLARLISALDASIESTVICLSSGGPMADRIRAMGVRVDVLGLPTGPRALLGLPRLAHMLREQRPSVVHTWLYHADLLGGLTARHCRVPVIWGLHGSTLEAKSLGYSTGLVVRLLAKLSTAVPARIVSCSQVGLRAHQAGGYDGKRMLVIENGFDTQLFQPSLQFREEARRSWHYDDELVVGHVARFNPVKDHETFLKAAGIAMQREPRLRFVLYGDNVTRQNAKLVSWARSAGVLDHCSFLGREPAVERRLPGFDLLVSSSKSEAFPLVLGEAMASGVPCVTTDVGDSAEIVGDSARVVPPSDPAALADAIVRAVQLDASARDAQISAGIARIRDRFALSRVAERFRDLYLEVAARQL